MYRKKFMRFIAAVLTVALVSMQIPAAAFAAAAAGQEEAAARQEEAAARQEEQAVEEDNTEKAAGEAGDTGEAAVEAADNGETESGGEAGGASDGAELPYDMQGMPEGYELSEEELITKERLNENDIPEKLKGMEPGVDYAEDEVICPADSRDEAEAIAGAYGGELIDFSYGVATISLKDTPLTVAEAVKTGADKDVKIPAVDPNYIIHTEEAGSDEEYTAADAMLGVVPQQITHEDVTSAAGEYGFDDPALDLRDADHQWMHDRINTYGAWGVTTGSSSVTVAVIDTGVQADHEELRGGRVTTVDIGAGSEDTEGSGTHAAGIIAATAGNGKGGAGIAPGVSILSIRAGKSKTLDTAMAARAVNYVSGSVSADGVAINGIRKADIINIGWGFSESSETFKKAIEKAYDAGVTVCAAMGDDKANYVRYPAKYDHVIAVCAVDASDARAEYSNFGSWADIAAPGSGIYSTYCGGASEYKTLSGTGAATAVISGVCALYMSAMGHVHPDTMERIIKKSVNKFNSKETGAGIIDASKLFSGDTTAPVITLKGGADRQGAVIGTVQDAKALKVKGTVSTSASIRIERAAFNGSGTYQGSDDTGNRNREIIIYTTNEKTPEIKNGEIKEGKKYEGEISLASLMESETKKKTITIKAACVTGMGVISKVTEMTFTVDPDYQPKTVVSADSVSITNAPEELVAGKSITLKAKVGPEGEVSQSVTWRIASYKDGDLSKAKIDASKGTLTTNASQGGVLTVEAISFDGNARGRADIRIVRNKKDEETNPVNYIALEHGKRTMNIGEDADLSVAKLFDTKNNDLIKNGRSDDLSFSWSTSNKNIVDIGQDGSGKALIKAVGKGKATVTCQVMDGSGKKASCTVTVVLSGAVTTTKTTSVEVTNDLAFITPDEGTDEWLEKKAYEFKGTNGSITALKLFTEETNGGIDTSSIELEARALFDYEENTDCGLTWTSSNSKVVEVEPATDGKSAVLTAKNKGKAKITCTATDGSKKKAVVNCTVALPVESIEVTGQSYIAKESSAVFKASKVLTKKADNRGVTWSIEEEKHPGISIDAKTGKVTVGRLATYKAVYTVVATAKDGSAVVGIKQFAVSSAKRTKVKITTVADSKIHAVKKDKNKVLKSVQVFTADTKAASSDERELYLYGDTYTGSKKNTTDSILGWKSGNEKVATVEVVGMASDGSQKVRVTGVGKGSTDITCTALDGSGKKASVKVYVKVPVSGIILTPEKGRTEFVGFGKNVKTAVGYGDVYGTPSKKGVTWSYEALLVQYSPDGEIIDDGESSDANVNGMFSLDKKTGKLSVKSSQKYNDYMKHIAPASTEYGYYEIVARVEATAADGSGEKSSIIYRTCDPAVSIGVYISGGTKYVEVKSASLGYEETASYKIRCKYSGGGQDPMVRPSVQSSNTAIATAYCDENGNLIINTGKKKGTAKITITTSDGSNKKCVFKVTVG